MLNLTIEYVYAQAMGSAYFQATLPSKNGFVINRSVEKKEENGFVFVYFFPNRISQRGVRAAPDGAVRESQERGTPWFWPELFAKNAAL